MTDKNGVRRSWTVLGIWYALALILPFLLMVTESEPESTTASGRIRPCEQIPSCVNGTSFGTTAFEAVAVFLAASLVIAWPLRAYLLRTWGMPGLAATVAAFTAWLSTGLLYCLVSQILS